MTSLQCFGPLLGLDDVTLHLVDLLAQLLGFSRYLVNCSVWQSVAHILVKDPELLFEVLIAPPFVLALLLVVHGHRVGSWRVELLVLELAEPIEHVVLLILELHELLLGLDELLHLWVLLLHQRLQDLLLLVCHVLQLGLLLQLLLVQVELVHFAFKLAFLDFSDLLPRQHLVRVVSTLVEVHLEVGVQHVGVAVWQLATLLQLLIQQHLHLVHLVLLL